jgi:hypothetical protein
MVMALLGQPYLIPRRADLKPIGPVLKCSLGPFHRFENHLLTTGIRNHIPVIRTRSVGNNPETHRSEEQLQVLYRRHAVY